MAGKRLIDAAKLLDAGSNVAKQHFVLRRQQWDVYTRTSTVAKAVRGQTDRVTVTAKAAVALARRFAEEDGRPRWVQAPREDGQPGKKEEVRTEVVGEEGGKAQAEQDDGSLSALRKREAQRRAEDQIPAVAADSQPKEGAARGQDTFSEPSESTSVDLSSLPRTKLPKHVEDAPEVNTDAFHSPKVARTLGQTAPAFKNPYAGRERLPPKPLPEMVAAREKWEREKQATPAVEPEPISKPSGDAETQDLAASIAQEAQVRTKRSPTCHHILIR
jgi:aarF domain-containing kinase